MRLSISQVIVVWAVVLGTIIASFFVGYWKGRDEGVEVALREQGREGIRLPIASDVALDMGADSQGEFEQGDDINKAIGLDSVDERVLTREPEKAEKEEEDVAFDFSGNNVEKEIAELKEEIAKNSEPVKNEKPAAPEKEIVFSPSLRTTGALESDKKVLQSSSSAVAAKVPEEKPVVKAAKEPLKQEIARIEPVKKTVPEKKAETVEKPPVSSPSKGLLSGWYVQVMAAKSRKEADQVIGKLSGRGYLPVIEEATVAGKQYFRIFAGPYKSKEIADVNRSKISSFKVSNGEPFLKKVN